MSKISIILVISFLVFNLDIFSQGTPQIVEFGDKYYEQKDFLGANYYYEKALNVDSSNAEVLYKYALSLSELNQNEKAARYFLKSSLIDRGAEFPDVYYRLAEAYRTSGDYRKARRYYNKAIIPYRSDRKSYWYKRIDQSKNSNTWAMKQSDSEEIDIQNLGAEINSSSSEFGASIYHNTIFYTSLRADSIEQDGSMRDKHYLSRILHQELVKGSKAKELRISSNSKLDLINKNWANFYLDEKSKTAYFSICDTNNICQIWSGDYDAKKIEVKNAKALNRNINDPSSNNTQAQLIELEKEKYLLFVSNRERGFGGYDLWLAKKEDFGFDEALNLGNVINTEGNEITPFYHKESKTLFFSSDWHNGFGGYDNFQAIGDIKNIKTIKNLGNKLNSSQDDYYFFAKNNKALISSNKIEDNIGGFNSCCNDLYIFNYEIEEIEEIETKEEFESFPIIENVVSLNKYLPLNLYFHNDSPDPNSRDTTTKENYKALVQDYLELENEYVNAIKNSSKYAQDEVELDKIKKFFEEDIITGIEDLEFFTPLLKQELDKGAKIQLTIKGFASSLFSADYNLNLTLRRIQSLINYFAAYENGALRPYLNGSANNGGKLIIQKLPYGEFASTIYLDEDDPASAIYSKAAAEQRKIEMIAIEEIDGNMKNFDSQTSYLAPKIEFNSTSYSLGKVNELIVERFFLITNTGGADLEIYNIIDNCDCLDIKYPKLIKKNMKGKIVIRINTQSLKDKVSIELTVVSNSQPNIHVLKIDLEK